MRGTIAEYTGLGHSDSQGLWRVGAVQRKLYLTPYQDTKAEKHIRMPAAKSLDTFSAHRADTKRYVSCRILNKRDASGIPEGQETCASVFDINRVKVAGKTKP